MFEKCCEFEDDRENIVCEEKRTKITFRNPARKTVAKIRIDGCVIADNAVKKCDYLLLCAGIKKAVFVELKGNKATMAIEQLSATLDNAIIKEPLKQYDKRAYAVVTKYPTPSAGTTIQNALSGFNKKHKQCTLRLVKSPYTCDLVSRETTT